MGDPKPRLFMLHAAGRADIGVPAGPEHAAHADEVLARLEGATPDECRRLLLLRDPRQVAGEVAPLAAASRQLDLTDDPEVHVVIMTTDHPEVGRIAQQVAHSLQRIPDLYGATAASAEVVASPSLEEQDAQPAMRRHLAGRVLTSYDRAVVTWGSGATQLTLDGLDAVVASGMPWSLVEVSPVREARLRTYDPTSGLSIDPLVPLLRRWRYHDLLNDLHQEGLLRVTPQQARRIEQEAEWWGHGYVEPSVERLLALVAAALVRRDGSSGFAVRAYVEHRYRALLMQDNARLPDRDTLINLLKWAGGGSKQARNMLGQKLGRLQRLERSMDSPSGRWLLSPRVRMLNEFGAMSSHERQGPPAIYLDSLRDELAEVTTATGPATGNPFDRLPLVPADRLWYVSLVGKGDRPELADQIAAAAVDPARRGLLDRPVRRYLGAEEDEPLPLGFLLLGTRSGSASRAEQLERRIADRFADSAPDLVTVVSDVVADQDAEGRHVDFREQDAYELLHRHLGDDTGAIVLVPTGQKPHVLSVMIAAQRLAAERGIPMYLRQLADKQGKGESAQLHRLPLRFGTDAAILTAALHALEIGELDTAARLLGAASDGSRSLGQGRSLTARVAALSHALRCDLEVVTEWPQGLGGPWPDHLEPTLGLLPDRIALWATLPRLANDVATQSRAVIGACASIEQSIRRFASAVLGDEQLKEAYQRSARATFDPLYRVRNQLPISHGRKLPGGTVDNLVGKRSRGSFTTTVDLLIGMAEAAGAVVGRICAEAAQAGHLPPAAAVLPHQRRPADHGTLPAQYEQLRGELRRMLDSEHGQLPKPEEAYPGRRPPVPERDIPAWAASG